jgi:hypothetical protein
MNFRAFEDIEELEGFCNGLDKYELSKAIQDGYEEYGYKINPKECAFSKDELSEMSRILDEM